MGSHRKTPWVLRNGLRGPFVLSLLLTLALTSVRLGRLVSASAPLLTMAATNVGMWSATPLAWAQTEEGEGEGGGGGQKTATSGKQSVRAYQSRAEVFLQAKNHPSTTANIQSWTTPRSVPEQFVPKVEQGMLYSGVLKRVKRNSLILTTWDGDVELLIRRQDSPGQPASRLLVGQSPSHDEPISDSPVQALNDLETDQFVSIYASAKTREIVSLEIFQQADP